MRFALRATLFIVLAAAAVAVLVVPRPHVAYVAPPDRIKDVVDATKWRYSLQSELLRRADARDLARTAVQHALPKESFSVVRPASIPAALETQMRLGALRARADLPRKDPEMRIVLVLTVDTARGLLRGIPVAQSYNFWSVEAFPPGSVADNVCVVVGRVGSPGLLTRPEMAAFAPHTPGPSGVCWWYAAYGTPGRGIRAWLDSTGYGAIMRRDAVLPHPRAFQTDDQNEAFWLWYYPQGRFQASTAACSAGRLAECSKLILRPLDAWWDDSDKGIVITPGWVGARRWTTRSDNVLASALLHRLEVEVGPDAFATFWKSDAPLSAAFETARAEPLDQWIHRQVVSMMGTYHRGPLPVSLAGLSLLLAIPLLIAIGVAAVARRGEFA